MKTFKYEVTGSLQQDETGPEVQIGDQVKLFLDTEANPAFPEFIFGVVNPPIARSGCCDEKTIYTISYNENDLNGAQALLRQGDILNVTTTAAVDVVANELLDEVNRATAAEEVLQDNIDAEEAARIADVNAEEAARVAADNALDSRLDVLEPNVVRYTAQTESSARQEQARVNLGMPNRTLLDQFGGLSVDWNNRIISNPDIGPILYWNTNLVLADGVYVNTGTSTGTSFGETVLSKVSFHGVTPVIQRADAAQAAVVTTAATTGSYGFTQTQADSIVTLLNEIRTTLVQKGIMKGSA